MDNAYTAKVSVPLAFREGRRLLRMSGTASLEMNKARAKLRAYPNIAEVSRTEYEHLVSAAKRVEIICD